MGALDLAFSVDESTRSREQRISRADLELESLLAASMKEQDATPRETKHIVQPTTSSASALKPKPAELGRVIDIITQPQVLRTLAEFLKTANFSVLKSKPSPAGCSVSEGSGASSGGSQVRRQNGCGLAN